MLFREVIFVAERTTLEEPKVDLCFFHQWVPGFYPGSFTNDFSVTNGFLGCNLVFNQCWNGFSLQ